MFFRRFRQLAWSVVLFLVFASSVVSAQSFGGSAYGSCDYGSDCPNATPSSNQASDTTLQLSTGLLVSVNLQDGQIIPESGYTIIVTPLNGKGTSFRTVSFAIDGTTDKTMGPASNGTAQWLWSPKQYEGTHVTVTVVGQDGEGVTKNYTVILDSDFNSTPAATIQLATPHSAIGRFIDKLPRPIVYSFPYLLFALLALSTIIALVQTYREVAETKTLQHNLKQLKQVDAAKRDFISLASHYLRTPITLLQGGLEMFSRDTPNIKRVSELVQLVHDKTEALISSYEDNQVISPTSMQQPHVYRSVRFWIPIALAGCLAFCFDYLAESGGNIAISRINIYTQLVTFVVLTSLSYIVVRTRQLRRRDVQQLNEIMAAETTLIVKRERFIDDSVAMLDTDARNLSDLLAEVPDNQGTQFMKDGIRRLDNVLAKCETAASLKGSSSTKQVTSEAMRDFLARVTTAFADEAKKNDISIAVAGSDTLSCRESDLLTLACSSVLENALTYAPAHSTIAVTGKRVHGDINITVTDHGAGIPQDKQSRLFEPFAKGEGAETFNHEGAGLSLYLDKLIMLYLGGDITITSEPNIATTASLILHT